MNIKRILIPLLLIILMASMVAFGASVPLGPNFDDTALSYGNDGLTLDTALTNISALTYVSPSFIKLTGDDTYAVRTLAETKTDLSLNLVENTALSSWAGTASITTVGTIGTGAWNGDVLLPAYGGTGVANNAANTLTFTGNFSLGLTLTANTAVTMPISGTLATTSNKLSDFAATTSAELRGVISDEMGAGDLRFDTTVTSKNGVATLTVAEAGTILVSAGAGYTLTLPTAVGNTGLTYRFKKTDANYNLITLDAHAAETINYENATSAPCLTYPRLNTYGAEVTLVSDGSNWQAYDEKLGQVPECYVYLGANQPNLPTATIFNVNFDTETYDIGSNYNISTWVSGTADGTVADHLQDDGTTPFLASMVGYRVKNTTDNTYAIITAFNDTGDVTLSADIFVNGEGYLITYSKFIAPIPGTYNIVTVLAWDNVVADKGYQLKMYVGGSSVQDNKTHSSHASWLQITTAGDFVISKNSDARVLVYHDAGVNTVSFKSATGRYTFIKIRLISKD